MFKSSKPIRSHRRRTTHIHTNPPPFRFFRSTPRTCFHLTELENHSAGRDHITAVRRLKTRASHAMRVGQTHSLRYMTHAHTNPQQTPACPDTSDMRQLSEQTESRPPASQPFAAQQESAGAVPASQVHRVAAVPVLGLRRLPPKKRKPRFEKRNTPFARPAAAPTEIRPSARDSSTFGQTPRRPPHTYSRDTAEIQPRCGPRYSLVDRPTPAGGQRRVASTYRGEKTRWQKRRHTVRAGSGAWPC